MKTTLDLPDDLMREVKILAAQQGKKLKDVLADTLRSGLGATPQNTETSREISVGIASSTDGEVDHKVVFPDFNKLRKKLGTDNINGTNEVLRQRSEGS